MSLGVSETEQKQIRIDKRHFDSLPSDYKYMGETFPGNSGKTGILFLEIPAVPGILKINVKKKMVRIVSDCTDLHLDLQFFRGACPWTLLKFAYALGAAHRSRLRRSIITYGKKFPEFFFVLVSPMQFKL